MSCKRHTRLRYAGLVVLVSILLSGVLANSAPADSRPNVVLIMTDDQGWGDTHSQGRSSYADEATCPRPPSGLDVGACANGDVGGAGIRT